MKKHTLGVSLVVFFILLEYVTWILEPAFFGKLLDALIDKFYNNDLKLTMFCLYLCGWAFTCSIRSEAH